MQEREQIPEPLIEQNPEECREHRSANEQIRQLIADQDWLDAVADPIQGAIGKAMGAVGTSVTDFLHGTWLRHPLHPVLTDLPIGAWTAAMAMDVVDLGSQEPKFAGVADAAIALGIASALPTAASGTADWRHTHAFPRRVGLVHAVLNVAGLLFQIIALGFRLRGNRRRGVALSALGYLSTTVAAWLGGTLVYEEGLGIDHTVLRTGPKEFVTVLPEAQLGEGELRKVDAKGVPVLLHRYNGQIYAIAETCSHQGGPLSQGHREGGVIVCPWHGSQFRLQGGTLVHGPSTFDQPCFDVRIRNGQIEVRRASRFQ